MLPHDRSIRPLKQLPNVRMHQAAACVDEQIHGPRCTQLSWPPEVNSPTFHTGSAPGICTKGCSHTVLPSPRYGRSTAYPAAVSAAMTSRMSSPLRSAARSPNESPNRREYRAVPLPAHVRGTFRSGRWIDRTDGFSRSFHDHRTCFTTPSRATIGWEGSLKSGWLLITSSAVLVSRQSRFNIRRQSHADLALARFVGEWCVGILELQGRRVLDAVDARHTSTMSPRSHSSYRRNGHASRLLVIPGLHKENGAGCPWMATSRRPCDAVVDQSAPRRGQSIRHHADAALDHCTVGDRPSTCISSMCPRLCTRTPSELETNRLLREDSAPGCGYPSRSAVAGPPRYRRLPRPTRRRAIDHLPCR